MKILIGIILLTSNMIYAEVTIHKQTAIFIDIEAKKEQVWVSCTNPPNSKNSYLNFYILDKERSYTFFYRRPRGIKQCQEEEKGPEPKAKEIPDRFTQVKKITAAVFIRLQAKDKCKAYFEEDCVLPKNYWGGVHPF